MYIFYLRRSRQVRSWTCRSCCGGGTNLILTSTILPSSQCRRSSNKVCSCSLKLSVGPSSDGRSGGRGGARIGWAAGGRGGEGNEAGHGGAARPVPSAKVYKSIVTHTQIIIYTLIICQKIFYRESGHCLAGFYRFYFDGTHCVRFTYGGCGGNANNFATEEECRSACQG